MSATCTIVPEEFPGDTISLSDICDVVEGAIIKRRAMGRSHGVVVLSEALVERFNPDEVAELQDVDRDAQGNIRVTEIDLGLRSRTTSRSAWSSAASRSRSSTRPSGTSCAARRRFPMMPNTRAISAMRRSTTCSPAGRAR